MAFEGKCISVKYRPATVFLLLFELFERIAYMGIQCMLFLYIKHELGFCYAYSIGYYHLIVGFSYMTSLLGTYIADKFIKKRCLILLMAICSLIGNIMMVISSVAPGETGYNSFQPHMIWLAFTGMSLRSLGFGGNREVIRTFGADHYNLPTEELLLRHYYKLYYLSLAIGMLLAFIIAPPMRTHVGCFGQLYCFPLPFVVCGVAMLSIAVLVLSAGCTRYIHVKPTGSHIGEFFNCVFTALFNKGRGKRFLDNADHKYLPRFIKDCRDTSHVLILFIPLPFFFAILEQQGSRWTYQATRMDGTMFGSDFSIEPDQMQCVNPLVIMLSMPLLEFVCYPLCRKCDVMPRPLCRVMLGGLLGLLAISCATVVELKVEEEPLTKYILNSTYTHQNATETLHNSFHMLWQIPQHTLLALAQILYPSVLLEFSYTQVRVRMKPVLLSFWLLSIALGNFIVMAFGFADIYSQEVHNYILFTAIMAFDLLILVSCTVVYRTVDMESDDEDEEEDESLKKL